MEATFRREGTWPDAVELVRALPTPTLVLDPSGTLVAVSDSWRGLMDEAAVAAAEQPRWLPGSPLLAALAESSARYPGYARVADRLRQALAGIGVGMQAEFPIPFPGETRRFIVATSSLAGGLLLFSMTDVTARRAAEAQLVHQATHDALTGLPNRAVLVERLRQIGMSRRNGEAVEAAVFFLDLDDFKVVNDTLGHAAGDRVLTEVAERLRGTVRADDLVVRLAADEFVVVAARLRGEREALAYADRLLGTMSPMVIVHGQPVTVRASLGIALSSADDLDNEALLRNADIAMLRAKADRSGLRVFDSSLDGARQGRVDAVQALREAIGAGEVQPWYQPVVDLNDGRVVGAEALVRWIRPDGMIVPPMDFIPLAERIGLIGPLDQSVMLSAAGSLAGGVLRHLGGCAVNASPLQVTSGVVVDEVQAVLAATGLDPGRLTVEVTETAVLGDPHAARLHLQELKAMGVRVALDDFGTGYSSLSHLAELAIDVVKLDRSFVRLMTQDVRAREISRAVVGLGAALGMAVIAEGVETEDQRDALGELGCPFVQGFLYGAAVPAATFERQYLRLAERPAS